MGERHEGVYLIAADIPYLPTQLTLEDGREVEVDYATEDQIPQVYKLVEDCRERGDNVAEGEFGGNYESWAEVTASHAWVFVVKLQGKIVGAFLLRPASFSRSIVPGTVELFIHLSPDVKKAAFCPLVKLAEKISLDLKLNYFAVGYSVFYSNQELIFQMLSLDYQIYAIIPYSGRLKGAGMMESCIMIKNVGPIIPPPEASLKEFHRLAGEYGLLEEEGDEEIQPPQIPVLPQGFLTRKGDTLLARNPESADHRWIYDQLQKSAARGQGYSIDDYPPYAMFRRDVLGKSHVAVLVLPHSGERVGVVMLTPSGFCRGGPEKHLVDTVFLVLPEYRSLGIGHDLMVMWFGFGKELGYKVALSSVLINTRGSFALCRGHDMPWVGTLPNMGHLAGWGWCPASINCKYLDDCPSFSEYKRINDETRMKSKI